MKNHKVGVSILVGLFMLMGNVLMAQHKCGKEKSEEGYTKKVEQIALELNLEGEKKEKFVAIHKSFYDQRKAAKEAGKDIDPIKEEKTKALKSLLTETEYDAYKAKKKALKEEQKKMCEESGCKKKGKKKKKKKSEE